jgi:hypothetical protein
MVSLFGAFARREARRDGDLDVLDFTRRRWRIGWA